MNIACLPGSGAAGGLGFGLAAFAGAWLEPGFALFAKHTRLTQRLRGFDLVITGEGAIDRSTVMGKGTGELALLCRKCGVPCIAIAGVVQGRPGKMFRQVHALTDFTTPEDARARPAFWLERLAANAAPSSSSSSIA